jgi:hypothetical protein
MRVSPNGAPPQPLVANVEAEQAILGAALINNRALEQARRVLRPEHFAEPVHGRIFGAMCRVVDRGRLADPITLRQEFDEDPALAQLDGARYLANLAGAAESIVNAGEYARVVYDLAVKRELAGVADRLSYAARNGVMAAEAWGEAQAALERVRPRQDPGEAGLVSPWEWDGEPEPRGWLVPEWVPAGEVVLLGGAGGVGKSLLAQQLLTSVAAGRPWLGMPVAPGAALGAFCEDDVGELRRRQADIDAHLGIAPDAYRDRLHYLARRGHDNVLMTWGPDGHPQPAPWLEELIDLAKRLGARLLVLDTLAHHFGGNENDRFQVTQFVSAGLYRIVARAGLTLVVCAHPSRAGLKDGTGLSGSTAWEGSVRSRLYFSRPEDGEPNSRLLERKKSNYSSGDEALPLVWSRGVVVSLEEKTGQGRPAPGTAFLDLLAELSAQGRYVSYKEKANNFAPTIMSRMSNSFGYTSTELRRAMEVLFSSRRIDVCEVRDRKRRLIEAIVPVGAE